MVPRFFMPDSPLDAKFLKGEDKLVAIERYVGHLIEPIQY
jgi:hypothetical protein